MNHLLVIGGSQGRGADQDMDIVHISARGNRDLTAVRCSRQEHLGFAMAAIRGKIDLLDIFDHGGSGYMHLGRHDGMSTILFEEMGDAVPLVGIEWAFLMDAYLTDTAHVRLLGCGTAAYERGRRLIYKLGRELGRHRVVWGTIDDTKHTHFQQGVFSEPDLLFSSLSAVDGVAPMMHQRKARRRSDPSW